MKSYIGDAVMTEPMLAAAEKEFARVEFDAGGPVNLVLWRPGTPRKFFPTPKPKKAWEIVVQARAIRNRSYDAVILVNRSFRSAFTVRLAGIKTRVGHSTEGRASLLTRSVAYDPYRFEALSQIDLGVLAGFDSLARPPHLPTSTEEQARGAELARGALVGVQAGTRWPGKQIPTEVTIAVTKAIVATGRIVALLGGIDDVETSKLVEREVGQGIVNLTGATSIRETLGVLTSLRAMIGGDTGLMHLAAAVNCPTVTAFGPTSHAKWGHEYAPHRILKAPESNMALLQANHLLECLPDLPRIL
jgi:heptosyltransferase-2